MKYNWKFVHTGHTGNGVKYMACVGDRLEEEFSSKLGVFWLHYATSYEKQVNFEGPRISDFIAQYNYNQIAIRENRPIKTDIIIMSLKDFNRLQKEIKKDGKKI